MPRDVQAASCHRVSAKKSARNTEMLLSRGSVNYSRVFALRWRFWNAASAKSEGWQQ
jgi:hypothetical protein